MPEDVACVVFGYKTSNTIIDIIRPYIPKTAALYCAVPGDRTFKINLIPLDVYQKHNNKCLQRCGEQLEPSYTAVEM